MTDIHCLPRLQAPAGPGWEEIRRALEPGLLQPLAQPWREAPEPCFAPCTVRMGLDGTHLLLLADLSDKEPANRATEWNQQTWLLGDALELFFQAAEPDAEEYYELHVTPENQRLQLRFPCSKSTEAVWQRKVPLSNFFVKESLFESQVRIAPDRDRWEAFMRIDLAPLLSTAGTLPKKIRFLISRYDYQPGEAKPVCSCNEASRLTAPNFHNRAGWTLAFL